MNAVLVAMVVYFAVAVAIGFFYKDRAGSSYLSWAIAGKQLSPILLAGTVLGSWAGAVTYVGWPGGVWKSGIAIGWQMFPPAFSMVVACIWVFPFLFRMTRVTLAEPFSERFDTKTRLAVAILSFVGLFASVATQILGVGAVVSTFTGMSVNMAMFLTLVVCVLYCFCGGTWSVSVTDCFQSLVMIIALLIVPAMLLLRIGSGSLTAGWGVLANTVPATHLNMQSIPLGMIVGYLISQTFNQFLRPHMAARIYGARSAKEGIITWVATGSVLVFLLFGVIVMGLAARVLVTGEATSSNVIPTVVRDHLPTWVSVLYAVGVLSAAMSTADSNLVGAASYLITDLCLPFTERNLTEKQLVAISRVATVVFGVLGFWWGISWKSILDIFTFGISVMVAGALIPFIGMFYWPRMTSRAAFGSVVLGGSTAVVWKFILQGRGLLPGVWASLDPVVPGLALSLLAAVLLTYTSPPEYDRVISFAQVFGLEKLQKRAGRLLLAEKSAQ